MAAAAAVGAAPSQHSVACQGHTIGQSHSLCPVVLNIPNRGGMSSTRTHHSRLAVRAVGWDPEGILADPVPHHIARRSFQKQAAQDEMQKERDALQRDRARQARVPPEGDAALVEYLMKIEAELGAEELEFEVARSGARLTDAFFSSLRSAMGTIRFAVKQTEGDVQRLAQLEKLEKKLTDQKEKQDTMRESLVAARQNLHELLSSPDKKEKILAMAAAGELNWALLSLLDENIAAAQLAQQAQAVEFMEKIRGAVVKYTPQENLVNP